MRAETMGEAMGGGVIAQTDWRPWYVVATLPSAEELACRTIGRLGIDTYLPSVIVEVRHGRRVCRVRRPAFRSYVFASFGLDDPRWPEIARCYGVSRLLTLADSRRLGIPAALPMGLVEAMQARGPIAVDSQKAPQYQKGDAVQVVEGPFSGLLGRIARLDSRGRCVLLLRILGGEIKVRAEVAQIAKR